MHFARRDNVMRRSPSAHDLPSYPRERPGQNVTRVHRAILNRSQVLATSEAEIAPYNTTMKYRRWICLCISNKLGDIPNSMQRRGKTKTKIKNKRNKKRVRGTRVQIRKCNCVHVTSLGARRTSRAYFFIYKKYKKRTALTMLIFDNQARKGLLQGARCTLSLS